MNDQLNTTAEINLIEKFKINDSVVIFNDEITKPKSKTNIELPRVQQEYSPNFATRSNGIQHVSQVTIKSCNSLEEEQNGSESPKKQYINKTIINFIWGIRQTLNVIIFIKKMKEYSRRYLFKSIKRQSFNVIGDQSSEYDYYVANNFIQSKEKMSILNMWRKVRQKRQIFQDCIRKIEGLFYNFFRRVIRTISPRNKIKIAWDIIVYFILTINIFYVPIKLSWEEHLEKRYSESQKVLTLILNDIPGWIFFFDIVLNFFTCYYEEGKLITKRRKIFVNYIKGKFWGDIIVVIPFLVNQYTHVKYLNIILLFRVNNMVKRMTQFEEMIDLSPNQQLLYDFFKIITTIIFISHFVGCFYFYLGQIEIAAGIENNWVSFYAVPAEFFSEYVYSIYWATITMVTIGYGDISPQSNYEKIYVMLVALIGCCYYAAIINSIGSILAEWQQRSQEKRKKVSLVISYLKKRGVDRTLQYKVKKQIAFAYEKDQDQQNEATKILTSLSTPLQKEIEKDIQVRVLRQIKFISNNYSDVFIQHLVASFKTKQCDAGETILDKNQIGDSIYCVMSGQFNLELDVEPYKQNESTLIIESFNILDSFGDYCFLTNQPSPGRFVSIQNSQLRILTKKDFESIIQLYPKDYEFYRMQIDQIQIDNCYKLAQEKCQVCKEDSHFFFKCPYTNLRIYKNKILNQQKMSQPNERVFYDRYRQEKQNSLCIIDFVRYSSIQYLFDKEMLDHVDSIEALMGDEQNLEDFSPQNQYFEDKMKFTDSPKEIQFIKDESPQTNSMRTHTMQYIIKKKKDIQAREISRQKFSKVDQRSVSLWNKDGREVKELKDIYFQRNSFNQNQIHPNHPKKDFYSKDPYTPLIQRIKKDEVMEKNLSNIESYELDNTNKFSSISNFDRMCNFNIYYPKGNFSQISKQKKCIKYFGKQKFKQSVEAIRKLLVFRSKMEQSGMLNSHTSSLHQQKSLEGSFNNEVVLYNKQIQQNFRKKVNTFAPSSFQSRVDSLTDQNKTSSFKKSNFQIQDTSIN